MGRALRYQGAGFQKRWFWTIRRGIPYRRARARRLRQITRPVRAGMAARVRCADGSSVR